jgi:hypothetical protein
MSGVARRLGLSSMNGVSIYGENSLVNASGYTNEPTGTQAYSVDGMRFMKFSIRNKLAVGIETKKCVLLNGLMSIFDPTTEYIAKDGDFHHEGANLAGSKSFNISQTSAANARMMFGSFVWQPQVIRGIDVVGSSDAVQQCSIKIYYIDPKNSDYIQLVDNIECSNYVKNDTFQSRIINVRDRDLTKWIVGPKTKLTIDIPDGLEVNVRFYLGEEFSGHGAVKTALK